MSNLSKPVIRKPAQGRVLADLLTGSPMASAGAASENGRSGTDLVGSYLRGPGTGVRQSGPDRSHNEKVL